MPKKIAKDAYVPCPVKGCTNSVPAVYDGSVGCSTSRFTEGLVICSACGTREAFGGRPLSMKQPHAKAARPQG